MSPRATLPRRLAGTCRLAGTFIAAALLAAASLPTLAGQPPTRRVVISDVDLSTPLGQQTFERRIAAAIEQVCPTPRTLAQRSKLGIEQARDCRAAAAASVQQQLARQGLRSPAQQARQN